jgi:hypothetical protein
MLGNKTVQMEFSLVSISMEGFPINVSLGVFTAVLSQPPKAIAGTLESPGRILHTYTNRSENCHQKAKTKTKD